jgi:hypothetical protein
MTKISRAELTISRSPRALAIAQTRALAVVSDDRVSAVRAGHGRLAL